MEKTGGLLRKIFVGGRCRKWLVLGVVALVMPDMAWAANWNPLPDTGQTQCYNETGNEVTCPAAGQPLYGQDAHYQGVSPAYHDNGNQTVTDQKSGLIWMKSDDGTARIWQGAGEYCNGLVFAGQDDWRLPTKFELDSIVDYGRSYPAMNPVFSCQSSFYWSAVSYTDDPAYAWGVYGNDGGDHWLDKRNRYYVRCVRAGL